MLILEIDYSNQFVIPEAMLPLIEQMVQVKQVRDEWIRDERRNIKVHIVSKGIATPEVAEKVSIESLKEESARMQKYWTDERAKTEKLEARIKELEAKT